MKTIVNIGCGPSSKDKKKRKALSHIKNITGVVFDKKFDDIDYSEIRDIVIERYGSLEDISIYGWCDVTDKDHIG